MKSKVILTLALGAALSMALPGFAQAPAQAPAQTPAGKSADQTKGSASKKAAEATPAPSDRDIADAKAKGMVWVNTNTKIYHMDGEYYGKTKKGKFMSEDEAKKAGYRAAQQPAAKKAKTDVSKAEVKK